MVTDKTGICVVVLRILSYRRRQHVLPKHGWPPIRTYGVRNQESSDYV